MKGLYLNTSTTKAGAKSYLLCHRDGKPATSKIAGAPKRVRGSELTGCKWNIAIEETTNETWTISKIHCLKHNHDLEQTNAQALAHASMRSIPSDLADFGTFLKQGGLSPAEILKYAPIHMRVHLAFCISTMSYSSVGSALDSDVVLVKHASAHREFYQVHAKVCVLLKCMSFWVV